MQVTVVVPTYRRPERLDRLLSALSEQSLDFGQFEVVVVDDCSFDETTQVIERWVDDPDGMTVRGMRTSENSGPAGARNVGWKAATTEIFAFTDDDCVPDRYWLERGVQAILADPELGVLQGLTRPADTGTPGRWVLRREVGGATPWFEACNVFYRRAAFEATGGFDESIAWLFGKPRAYTEDTAAGWAVLAQGWTRGFTPDAVVVHDLDERGLWWRVQYGYLERNLVRLADDHPDLADEAFWRPWSMSRFGPTTALAMLALAVSLRYRPALLGVLPYFIQRRGLVCNDPVLAAGSLVEEIARCCGHLAGSVPRGRIVL